MISVLETPFIREISRQGLSNQLLIYNQLHVKN